MCRARWLTTKVMRQHQVTLLVVSRLCMLTLYCYCLLHTAQVALAKRSQSSGGGQSEMRTTATTAVAPVFSKAAAAATGKAQAASKKPVKK
jgi:hypothetical protein